MTTDDRNAAMEKLQAEIDRANAKLDGMVAAARSKAADAKLKADLERRRDAAREQLSRLREGGAHAWSDLKAGFTKAYEDLRQAL